MASPFATAPMDLWGLLGQDKIKQGLKDMVGQTVLPPVQLPTGGRAPAASDVSELEAMMAPPREPAAVDPLESAQDAGQSSIERYIASVQKQEPSESLKAQMAGLRGNEDRLNKFLGQAPQMDLSPLLSLTDAWTGSKMASGYKAPMSAEEKSIADMKFQDLVQKQRGDLSQEEARQLAASLNNRLAATLGTQEFRNKKLDMGMKDSISKQITENVLQEKDPQKSYTAIAGVNKDIRDAVASGDLAKFNLVMSQIVRRIGGEKGNLSDSDISRSMFTTTGMDMSKWLARFTGETGGHWVTDPTTGETKLEGGKINPKVAQVYLDMLDGSISHLAQGRLENLNRLRGEYSDRGEFSGLMSPGAYGSKSFNRAENIIRRGAGLPEVDEQGQPVNKETASPTPIAAAPGPKATKVKGLDDIGQPAAPTKGKYPKSWGPEKIREFERLNGGPKQ